MKIRCATSEDIDVLVDARLRFNDELYPAYHVRNETLATQFRSYLPLAIESGDFIGVLGYVDEDLVSTVYLVTRDMPANSFMPHGRYGTLLNVFTFPQYRGQGYGKQAVEATIAKAREIGLEVIDLEATAMGRGLYENIGFSVRPLTSMRMIL